MRGKVAVYKGGKKYLGERRREEGRGGGTVEEGEGNRSRKMREGWQRRGGGRGGK